MKMDGCRMYNIERGHPISERKKSYTLSHMQNLFNHICVYMDICAYICVYTYKQIFMWVQITCRKENEKG